MVALTAVMRKPLTTLNAMVRTEMPWKDSLGNTGVLILKEFYPPHYTLRHHISRERGIPMNPRFLIFGDIFPYS